MDRSPRLTPPLALGAALLTCLALVGGCASTGNHDNASKAARSGAAAGDSAQAPERADAVVGSQPADGGGATGDAADVVQRSVIAKGALELSSRSVDDVRRRARDVVDTASGVVADEETNSDDRGRAVSVRLVVRVPVARFDGVLDALARLGRVVHRTESSEDVTTQVIDTSARVQAQRASVASIERLYTRANTIGEVMAIEAQLSKRQAALDSLERQQKYLADQTALATITVTITRTPAPATHAAKAGPGGFAGGLEDGWHALATVGRGLAVAVGALLPFAALAALLAVPVWLIVRRRRQRPAPAEPANG